MTTADATGTGLDPHQLATRLDADDAPTVVDVRTPAEFETAHIPGSFNVPLDTLEEHRAHLARHVGDEMVFVCRSGSRARRAERAAAASGMTDVHVLRGGIGAWESVGGELRRGVARWAMDRQVRLVAGGLVLASGLASLVLPRAKWLATGIGAGLAFSAVSDTCAMGAMLARLPHNRVDDAPSPEAMVDDLVAATRERDDGTEVAS